MGQLPIIRAPRGNAAEMVARKLDRALRDHLASSRGVNAFSGGNDGGFGARPRELNILSLSLSLLKLVGMRGEADEKWMGE